MKKMFWLLIPLILVGCSNSDFKKVGASQDAEFYTIPQDKSKSRDFIIDEINKACEKKDWCTILIWKQGEASPESFPLTDHEQKTMLVEYRKNGHTGDEKLLWRCSYYPDSNPANCFSS